MNSDKSIYFKLPKIGREGFFIQFDDMPYFYDKLHHHPELQLSYILSGTGDLFIGDSITPFEPGTLFLIGSNQNHLFKSDREYYKGDSEKKSQLISVFFHETSLGQGFFDISEVTAIRHLMDRADKGLRFSHKVASRVAPRMRSLLHTSGFSRFIEILKILHELAESEDYKYMAAVSSSDPPSDKESRRVNDVINYILNHYKEDIELEEIASVAHYSKAAFCKFFKQRTRKTFTEFLNEVRVSQACKLLQKTELNISEICYECGFNNVSNFNRQFKRNTGLTPREYAVKYERSLSNPSRNQFHLASD